MEVHFSDSFFESLKRLKWHNHPVYKFYAFFRYKLPKGIRNFIFFFKVIWEWRWWDDGYLISIIGRGLEDMAHGIEHYGLEVDESRLKKVAKMRRCLEIIYNIENDRYIELAEKELGAIIETPWDFERKDYEAEQLKSFDEGDKHNRKVFARARELENAEWKELWETFKGQDNPLDNFDGSGLNTWWD